jgi:hypothetical protein
VEVERLNHFIERQNVEVERVNHFIERQNVEVERLFQFTERQQARSTFSSPFPISLSLSLGI